MSAGSSETVLKEASGASDRVSGGDRPGKSRVF
jgi:hypothetical protein